MYQTSTKAAKLDLIERSTREALQSRRSDLLLESFEVANQAQNGDISPEAAKAQVAGILQSYASECRVFATAASSLGETEIALDFMEASKLLSPWKCENEYTTDRRQFDLLQLELDLLLLRDGDSIYHCWGV